MKYCHQCGTKVEDNAVFCSKCGTPLDRPTPPPTHKNQSGEQKGCGCGFIGCFSFVLILIVVLALAVNNPSGELGRFFVDVYEDYIPQKADNGDIDLEYDLNLINLSVTMIIVPDKNINDLEITLKYCDKDGTFFKQQVVYVGDVKKGVRVSKDISIFDFTMAELIKIDDIYISVSGGTANPIF